MMTIGQGGNFNIYLGGFRGLPSEHFVRDLDFLVATVVDQIVFCPMSCPAKIHCTGAFALRNGKSSRLGGDSSPYPLYASSLLR